MMDQRRWEPLRRMGAAAQHVELGGSSDFADAYVEAMMFPETEEA